MIVKLQSGEWLDRAHSKTQLVEEELELNGAYWLAVSP